MCGQLGDGGFRAVSGGEACALQLPCFILVLSMNPVAREPQGSQDIGTRLFNSSPVPLATSMEPGSTLGAQQIFKKSFKTAISCVTQRMHVSLFKTVWE